MSARTRSALRRVLYPAYRKLETVVHPLRYLFVEITQRCNLSCLHCGSDCGRSPRTGELSTDEWLSFFGLLKERVEPRKLVLIVTGGEPFCHPEFDRILEGLERNGLTWGMVTNGWALTDANVRKLAGHGIATATVSLDGLPATHDWLRGRRGSFQRALSGMQRLAGAGLPYFDVVTCVHPGNLAQLENLYALLNRSGVRAWRLFSIFPRGRAATNQSLMLSPAQFDRMLGFIRLKRRTQGQEDLRVSFSCEGYLPADLDHEVRDEPYFCRAGISIGSVLCDGAISACPNIDRSLVQGNIRTDDFMDVWEKRFRPFRDRGWMKTGACENCTDWKQCQGNSLHLWDPDTRCTSRCTFHQVSA